MKKYHYPPEVSFFRKLDALFSLPDSIKIMNKQFAHYGDEYTISTFWMPNKFVFTRNPEFTEHFLRKKHRLYEKSIFQTEMLKKYVGNGLLTNSGEHWKRQRRLIQPGFSHKKIESLNELMLEEIQKSIEAIPENETVDFYPIFNRLAFRVVAKSLFSSKINEDQIEIISEVVNKSQETFTQESSHPIMQFWLQYSGKIKRHLKNDVKPMRDIFKNLIDERKASDIKYDDILDLMLDSRYEDTGEPMEEEQLIDELLILFVAGHETTANALSFTFWLLGKHPEIQQKLKRYIQDEGSDLFELQHLFEPSYIQNIIKESMRLYPPAWVIDRQALEDDTFKDYHFEKGTIVVSNIFAMNRLESIWKDAESFQPERFEDEDIKTKPYIPFGSGPRYCIGEHFAIMEMQMVLRAFFQKFNFELMDEQLKLRTYVTLRPNKVMGKKLKQ